MKQGKARQAVLAKVTTVLSHGDRWFDYRLENHPEFLRLIAKARQEIRQGRSVRLEDVLR